MRFIFQKTTFNHINTAFGQSLNDTFNGCVAKLAVDEIASIPQGTIQYLYSFHISVSLLIIIALFAIFHYFFYKSDVLWQIYADGRVSGFFQAHFISFLHGTERLDAFAQFQFRLFHGSKLL